MTAQGRGSERDAARAWPPTRTISSDGPSDRAPRHTRLATADRRVRRRRDRVRRAVHIPGHLGGVRGGVRDQPNARSDAVDDVSRGHRHRQPAPRPRLRRVRRSRSPHRVDGPARRRLAGRLPRARHLARDPCLRGAPRPGTAARVHRDVDRDRATVRGDVGARARDHLRGTGPGRGRCAASGGPAHREQRLAFRVAGVPRGLPRGRRIRLAHDERAADRGPGEEAPPRSRRGRRRAGIRPA